jgi:hypothetical protein
MVDLLIQYFIQYKEVLFPGLGYLTATQSPARYDSARQVFLPPGLQFHWQPDAAVSLQPLLGFVSKQTQLSEEECFEKVHEWSSSIKKQVFDNGEWAISGLGKLVLISGEKIGFVPEAGMDKYEVTLEAPRALHSDRAHQILVGDTEINSHVVSESGEEVLLKRADRWWIPSLILGIVTCALIVYKLMQG